VVVVVVLGRLVHRVGALPGHAAELRADAAGEAAQGPFPWLWPGSRAGGHICILSGGRHGFLRKGFVIMFDN